MKLYTLTSDLHNEMVLDASKEQFIIDIEKELGESFEHRSDDYSDYGQDPQSFIYVRTGGTEGIFQSVFCQGGEAPQIPGGAPVRIITSGKSNSLAASMEILSFLRKHGLEGEILHGTAAQIAGRIRSAASARTSGMVKNIADVISAPLSLRLGVVGRPSDWLISSGVNYADALSRLGVELVDISMEEMLEEFHKGGYELPDCVKLNELNAPKYGNPIAQSDLETSLNVYGALKRLVLKYGLSGVTIRCFDLLSSIKSTGCMALAILNAEGITGTCEGDVPALLSMILANKLTGCPGFQVNLSRVSGDELLFAHCTVPLNMVENWCYDTHFESGIGVAVHGEFNPGPATIFKVGADLRHFIAEDVEITGNQYENNLCRTQILVNGKGVGDYMLGSPLGNHHVILTGHHAAELTSALTK